MTVDPEVFLDIVKRKLGEHPTITPAKSWVGGRASPDGAAVVLYQAMENGPIIGRRWVLSDLALLFATEDARILASAVYTSEIAEPEGDVKSLEVDWAAELVDNPFNVLWAGIA